MAVDPKTIGCCDSCGTAPIPADDVDLHGWQRLPLTGRVRCLSCYRALERVNAKPQDAALVG